jgi:SAM-dependent methyltransferase
MGDIKKLDLGSGGRHLPGYTSLDKDPATRPDVTADMEKGLPFGDNAFDEVRASHVLEHIHTECKVFIMYEIWRVLKPGGIAEVALPAFPFVQSVMDPTHLSYWCAESFFYFEHGNRFRDAFASRYSECPVPSFRVIEKSQSGFEFKIKLEAVKD